MVKTINKGNGLIYICPYCFEQYGSYGQAFLCEASCKRKNLKKVGQNGKC